MASVLLPLKTFSFNLSFEQKSRRVLPSTDRNQVLALGYSMSRKSLNKRRIWTQRSSCVSGRLIICMQMHTDACTWLNTDACRVLQLHPMSKLLYVYALNLSPRQSLSHVGSFSRTRDTIGNLFIVSETPPTNLTVLWTNIFLGGLRWFLDMFYWEILAV